MGVRDGWRPGTRGPARVSKGLGGFGLEGAEGLGGWNLGDETDNRTFVRSLICLFVRFVRTDGQKFPHLYYRTSSPLGPLPKNVYNS